MASLSTLVKSQVESVQKAIGTSLQPCDKTRYTCVNEDCARMHVSFESHGSLWAHVAETHFAHALHFCSHCGQAAYHLSGILQHLLEFHPNQPSAFKTVVQQKIIDRINQMVQAGIVKEGDNLGLGDDQDSSSSLSPAPSSPPPPPPKVSLPLPPARTERTRAAKRPSQSNTPTLSTASYSPIPPPISCLAPAAYSTPNPFQSNHSPEPQLANSSKNRRSVSREQEPPAAAPLSVSATKTTCQYCKSGKVPLMPDIMRLHAKYHSENDCLLCQAKIDGEQDLQTHYVQKHGDAIPHSVTQWYALCYPGIEI